MGHLDDPDLLFSALNRGKIVILPRPPWPNNEPVAIPHKDLKFEEIQERVTKGDWLLMKTPPLTCMHCQQKTVSVFKFVPNFEGHGEDILLAKCSICPEEKSGIVIGLRPKILPSVEKIITREKSPEYDDFNYERVLQWGEAVLNWNDTVVDGNGNERPAGEHSHWSLKWKHGFIGFDAIEKDQPEQARKAAALFISLWTRGVDAAVSERCATAYVLMYKISRL